MKGKTALITGSTSGIGLGIAEAFGRAGANLVINGFGDETEIEAIRSGLEKANGVRVIYDDADMSKPSAIEGMMDRAAKAFGGIDVLINNAGIQHVCPVEEFPVDKWDAILAINLSSSFHTIRKAVPAMKARGMTEEQVKRDVLLHAQATKQFVTVEQVAGTALFLCSNDAASITGTNISVEGGWTAQ
jgi:3-hydroxybutyrate dehydrogenase